VIPLKQETREQSHSRIVQRRRQLLVTYSSEKAAALIVKFKEKDVWQTPTLILLKNDAFPTLKDSALSDDREKYIPSRTLAIWKKALPNQ
jgi:hypothetical protein